MAHQLELRISSDPRWCRTVRAMMQEIARQAGFSDMERHDISLAIDEALANVIKHSYKGDPNGPVSLTCAAADGWLEVVLRDQGEGFDPKKADHLAPDELRVGGRGVFLMRATMDEVEFGRAGETNTVRLRKYLKAQDR